MDYFILIIGFLFLIKGSDYFIDGASSLAKRYGVPPIVIGLTIVSLGTSAPEIAVGISSAIKGANDLTLGNVVGSNIFNLLVVVGSAAAMRAVAVKKDTIRKEFPFLILNNLVLLIMAGDVFLGVSKSNVLDRGDGLILLSFFLVFLYYLAGLISKNRESVSDDIVVMSTKKSAVLILLGGVGIWLGGGWVVESASSIALSLGISRTVVGFTVIAIGTSLPELVTSVVASRKGENEIIIGNVVGSNICNFLLVLGISSTISPIEVEARTFYDLLILSIITVIAFYFSTIDEEIKRKEGASLLIMYLAYMVYMAVR